jgi:hypothetical protein
MRLTSLASLALFLRKKNLTLSLLLLIPSNKVENIYILKKKFHFTKHLLQLSKFSSIFLVKICQMAGIFFRIGRKLNVFLSF